MTQGFDYQTVFLNIMKKRGEEDLQASQFVASKLRKIINDRELKQSTIAEYAKTTPSQLSRMLNGLLAFSLQQIANIASGLNMEIIDIYTYPDKYVNSASVGVTADKDKVSVTFEVDPSQRDYLLHLVMGKGGIKNNE